MSVRQKQEESKKKMEKEHDELTQRKIENIRPYRFQKGQSGNPKGRKPLSIKSVCDALKKDGYKFLFVADNPYNQITKLRVNCLMQLALFLCFKRFFR